MDALTEQYILDANSNINIYLLPHQDDEAFVFEQIRFDLRNGIRPICIFLTQNSDKKINQIRNSESRRFLSYLGVDENQVFFLGELLGVDDGCIVRSLNALYEQITLLLGSKGWCSGIIKNIFVPAYEGGHPDHDAAFWLGVKMSQKMGELPLAQYWCYNGDKCLPPLFRVKKVIESNPGIKKKVQRTFIDIWTLVRVPFFYPSQIKSWIGLYPEFLLRGLFCGLSITYRESKQIDIRPHPGVLLYEQWGRTTFDSWLVELKSNGAQRPPVNHN